MPSGERVPRMGVSPEPTATAKAGAPNFNKAFALAHANVLVDSLVTSS